MSRASCHIGVRHDAHTYHTCVVSHRCASCMGYVPYYHDAHTTLQRESCHTQNESWDTIEWVMQYNTNRSCPTSMSQNIMYRRTLNASLVTHRMSDETQWVMSHINEANHDAHTYHTSTSCVRQNESWDTTEWVMSHINEAKHDAHTYHACKSCVRQNESRDTIEWVMSHITQQNESCPTSTRQNKTQAHTHVK